MNYLIIDTEGSGVFDYTKPADAPGQPRMAAFAMITCNDRLEIEGQSNFLIRPNGWTFDDSSDAAKVNGLTHARLMDEGIEARDVLRLYGEAIDARRIVVGYNVLHDLKQLRAEMRFVGYPDRFMQTRYICAMQGCRQIVDARTPEGRKKAPKLHEACAYFGIVQAAQHTALDDAASALAILRHLRDRGAMPAYKDPYDREPKRAPKPKLSGRSADQVIRDDPHDPGLFGGFVGGANEDGK